MSYLPPYKFGLCSQCGTNNTPCVKVGKELFCLKCNNDNKTKIQIKKASDKRKLQTTLSKLSKTTENKELVKKAQNKSELLRIADKLFGDFIKNKDKDKNGQAKCPCCGNDVLVEINGKSNPDCNIMHFIDRGVYSLRYDEDNAAAGHSWCNRRQHFFPTGIEYQQFKNHLIEKLGEEVVAEMEIAHRKINKLDTNQLKVIIELYTL